MADQAVAQHTITLNYSLSHGPDGVTIRVHHVKAHARRENYQAKLDSDRPGDLVRIKGGADTLIMYPMVQAFSLYQLPLETQRRNHLLQPFQNAGAAADALMSYHPSIPRKQSFHQQKVALTHGSKQLLNYLFPASQLLPESGVVTAGYKEKQPLIIHQPGYSAKGFRAVSAQKWRDSLLLQAKGGASPIKTQLAQPKGNDSEKLLELVDELSVQLKPDQLCFEQAAQSTTLKTEWRGPIEGVVSTQNKTKVRTLIWRRIDGKPKAQGN